MWRQTLRRVIEEGGTGKVVAEAGDGESGIDAVIKHRPAVAVVDINLPGLDGHAATRRLLQSLPDLRVLVLSASDERRDVITAMRAGAAGYLLKTALPAEVVDGIRRVAGGELVLPPELTGVVLQELRNPGQSFMGGGHTVALADASALSRAGITAMLREAGLDMLADTDGISTLLQATEGASPAVLVLDGALVGADARETIDGVRRAHPSAAILVLCERVDEVLAAAVLEGALAGAGCLLKSRVKDAGQLVDAVCRVANGASVVDSELARQLLERRRTRDPLSELNAREREVLALMAEGRSNQAICEQLFMSAKSVEGHVRNIFMKLDLEPAPDDNRRVLAVLAYLRAS